MNSSFIKDKSFAIYGLGVTGKSALNFLRNKKIKKIITWDDNFKEFKKKEKNFFFSEIDKVDYILISPGINIGKSKYKKNLLRNKKKIITDLDLFFLNNVKVRSIFVTGTNGKSTTCSLIDHVLRKNNYKTELVGNIGKPILSVKFDKNKIYIVEASSFQLNYSKFIKPDFALLLNITRDHLDWHNSMSNYIYSKFKIFENQTIKDKAIIKNKKLKKIYIEKKFQGKLLYLSKDNINNSIIRNNYLKLNVNKENIEFAFAVSKIFKINKRNFLSSLVSFKGLAHRQEFFKKYKNFNFINDSKATSLEASKFALLSHKNILWILGGLPKKNDKIQIGLIKKRIIKSFIVGKYAFFFKKKFQNKLNFQVELNLQKTIHQIFKFIKNNTSKETHYVLFSPASASYDQYNNFVERGDHFKKLVKNYVKKLN